MRLLLDSMVIIWRLMNDTHFLSEKVQTYIDDPDVEVAVSAASVWEIEIKRSKGKLLMPPDLLAHLDKAGFALLSISPHDAVVAAGLPMHHADPFDRMLIAQAQRQGWTIVTSDPHFAHYQVALMAA